LFDAGGPSADFPLLLLADPLQDVSNLSVIEGQPEVENLGIVTVVLSYGLPALGTRTRLIANTSPPSRTTAERYIACPVSMFRSPTKRPVRMTPIVRLTGEVVDYLYFSFEDDDEVVGGVACPKEACPASVLLDSP
jgi:hypothetical protein